MIHNLKGKLDALRTEKASVPSEPPVRSSAPPEPVCRFSTHRYSSGYSVGHEKVGIGNRLDPGTVSAVFLDSTDSALDPEQFLYLDTETTGLSTGSGMLAFLVGIGYYEGDDFVTEQYLLQDYDQEPDLLKRLMSTASRFDSIVTFNGKCFDIPLLETRYVMNRIQACFSRKRSLDLLHAARRMYKRSLESCSLGSIEAGVLGLEREGDIPGGEIPEVFFNYLKDRDPTRINTVMEHNEQDVLTMPVLLGVLCRELNEKQGDPILRYSSGLIRLRNNDPVHAEECFRYAADGCREAKKELSLLLKRQGRWEEAAEIWKAMYKAGEMGTFPCHELAKYCEHIQKQPEQALIVVSRVRNRLLDWGIRDPEIEQRYNRLKSVCERRKG